MKFRWLLPALFFGFASTARAEEIEAKSEEEDETPLVPFERDHVSGHFQIGVSANYVAPFGRLSDEYARTARGGGGALFNLDLNYGLDRFVFIGTYGQYSLLGSSAKCEGCTATEWGAGLQAGYHLVQGLRIDPWISYGVGFRSLSAESAHKTAEYPELEWMRLSVGANWFATSNWALSPVAVFSAASTLDAPDPETAGRVDLRFVFGLRMALDFPGR